MLNIEVDFVALGLFSTQPSPVWKSHYAKILQGVAGNILLEECRSDDFDISAEIIVADEQLGISVVSISVILGDNISNPQATKVAIDKAIKYVDKTCQIAFAERLLERNQGLPKMPKFISYSNSNLGPTAGLH